MIRSLKLMLVLSLCLLAISTMAPGLALAIDGVCIPSCEGAASGGGGSGATYYQAVVGEAGLEEFLASEPGLPTSLYIIDSDATVTYVVSQPGANEFQQLQWLLKVRGLTRPHEQVDTVYQMIAVLPLPIDASGRAAFTPEGWGIQPREGVEGASVPLIYGGEKVVLKRNVTLEKTLLPNLVGEDLDKLPSLSGTGYAYTLWDAIVRYDPSFGDTVTVLADFRYRTDGSVAPPDPSDDRIKAYVVTWIPDLDASVPPYTVRMDVLDPEE